MQEKRADIHKMIPQRRTFNMYDKQTILDQLSEMNAPQGGVVLVHTSMRAVGPVEGGAEGLLDALIEYFTAEDGLLCIPTHTWKHRPNPENIRLDLTANETCIGILPTIAAGDPRGFRTAHPTHSMAVFGRKERVVEYTAGEDRRVTPADPAGCYGKLYTLGGKVLLIGVGHNSDTYLHSVEEMLDVPNRLDASLREVTVKYKNGDVSHRYSRGHHAEGISDVSAQFPNYEPAFRYHGCIVDGFIGNAPTQLCNARKMKQVLELIHKRSGGEELLDSLRVIPKEYYEGEI
jgi:aminoglycoside 3-N-acetyltransferase